MLEKLKSYKIRHYNFLLVLACTGLSILGIMIVNSAGGSYYEKRQILGLGLGLAAMLVVSLIDYHFYLRFYWLLYAFNIVLMLLVRFFGVEKFGAKRWFEFAGILFQPTELTKILMILFLAGFFAKRKEKINKIPTLLLTLICILIPVYLVEDQPDLSTSIVILVICACLWFLAGLTYKVIVPVLGLGIAGVFAIISYCESLDPATVEDYHIKRVLAWLHPEEWTNIAYQQLNAVMAVGSGQLWGKGLNNEAVDSVKNGNYISTPQTDFIFAIAGEELGFVGTAAIILSLLVITVLAIHVGRKAKDLEGKLIACGIGVWIGFQGFVNICVVTGLMPNTGLTLPFISYGLTSLVSLFIGIGICLNVGLQKKT